MNAAARVLVGLLAGAIIGLVLAWLDPVAALRAADIVQPVGRLWLNALQMTVVPLVLSLVVVGVTTASDAASSGRTARRAIVIFLVLLTAAAVLTALVAPLILSLLPRDPALADALRSAAGAETTTGPVGWADALTAIIPSNAIDAAAKSAMLPLVVFALFFGFALTQIDETRRALVVGFFQAVGDAMIVVVRWVLWVAPVGVFALVLSVSARAGLGTVSALGIYIALEIAMYLVITVLLLPVALVWGGEKLGRFMSALVPVQVVAASTQSSLATLPAMLESAEDRLGYPRQVAALVLPMAVSLFRITSPVQYVVSAAFIAWALGIQLTPGHLAAGTALAVVMSLSAVGLPGQVTFLATNLPVTQAMGLPVAPLALMLAVDTIPDVFATVGNVSADLTATSIVVRQSRRDLEGVTDAPDPTVVIPD